MTVLGKMTLREKIGQTLMVRQSDLLLRADKRYAELRDPSEAAQIMAANGFGAIWTHGNVDVNGMDRRYNGYFRFDSETLTKWITEVSADLPIRPICAADISGRSCCSDLGTYTTGLIVGAADSEELAFELGQCAAREHRAAGINWVWSPVVDLYCRLSTSLGRGFSNRQEQMIRLSSAFVKGVQSVGVAATVKHYPGADPHSVNDTHVTLSMNMLSMDEWRQTSGDVFQKIIDSGVDAVMDNAGMFPAMDDTVMNSNYIPMGLSKKTLIDVLRKEQGFEGVVITDDVNMGGFVSCYPHDELYGRMIEAGNDMLLGVGIDAVDLVEKCVERGIVSEERITEACGRVLKLKEKLGLLDENYAVNGNINVGEALKLTADCSRRIAEKGVTLLRNSDSYFPVRGKLNRVTIYSFSHRETFKNSLETMKASFERRGADVILKGIPESFDDVKEAAENSDLIIYACFIGHFAPKGIAGFYDDIHWSFRYAFTAGIEKSIGVSLGYPLVHSRYMKEAHSIANIYSVDPRVQEAFVSAVYGEIPFAGVSPVDLETPVSINI